MSNTEPKIFTPEYYQRMRELESGSWWNAGMRDVAEMLMSYVGVPARGTMLDVGCGSGQTMSWFRAQHPGWRTVGIDVAADAVAVAHRSGAGQVSVASALALPLPDRCVDFAVTLDVMQHLPLEDGDRLALRELRRVLKPGGHLFVRTNAQAFPRTNDDPEFNFRKYDPADFRAKLQAAGFTVIRLSRLNGILGLAEIPRELRAKRSQSSEYHGILAAPPANSRRRFSLKRAWLRCEGRLVRAGLTMPLGRTIVALCRS